MVPMTVKGVRDALEARGYRPSAATIYAQIEALVERGYIVQRRKREEKIAGKRGWYECVYSVVQVR